MSEHGGKTYRPWDPQRYQQEAHSPASKLPEGDLVFFLLDTVPSWMYIACMRRMSRKLGVHLHACTRRNRVCSR